MSRRVSRLGARGAEHTRSLVPRLVATILLISSGVGLLSGAGAIVFESVRLRTSLERGAQEAADRLATTLSYPIWNLVRREIEVQLDWALQDPDAWSAELEIEGLIGGQYIRFRSAALERSVPLSERQSFIVRRDVFYEAMPIARLTLTYSTQGIEKRLVQESISIAFIALTVVAALTVSLLLALQASVIEPLRRIERWAARAGEGALIRAEGRRGALRGEILSLSVSIERMAALLRERYALIEARELEYRSLFENSPVATWELDFSGAKTVPFPRDGEPGSWPLDLARSVRVRACNRSAISGEEERGAEDPFFPNGSAKDEGFAALLERYAAALVDGRRTVVDEYSIADAGGKLHTYVLRFAVLAGHEEDWTRVVMTATDITERARTDAQLKRAFAEKETLLHELFHRTRNNLQILSSLLSLRAFRASVPELKLELDSVRRRVHSMALAQDSLYESEDLARADFGAYVRRLLDELVGASDGKVRSIVHTEPSLLPADAFVPLGLAICELVSNSLRHAFPEGAQGSVHGDLRRLDDGRLELRIADDGRGPPSGFDPRRDAGLGLGTALEILEGQLRGEVSFDFASGFACVIRFSDLNERGCLGPAEPGTRTR